jgi:hypothetical protein
LLSREVFSCGAGAWETAGGVLSDSFRVVSSAAQLAVEWPQQSMKTVAQQIVFKHFFN